MWVCRWINKTYMHNQWFYKSHFQQRKVLETKIFSWLKYIHNWTVAIQEWDEKNIQKNWKSRNETISQFVHLSDFSSMAILFLAFVKHFLCGVPWTHFIFIRFRNQLHYHFLYHLPLLSVQFTTTICTIYHYCLYHSALLSVPFTNVKNL